MSLDRYRWDMKAQQLRFAQVEVARKQAESWRTGLAGLTTLFGAVLVVKGRNSFTDLAEPLCWIVAVFLILALAALLIATLHALSAAHGTPTDEILTTGEDLEDWSDTERARIRSYVTRARGLTLLAVALITAATCITWTGRTAKPVGTVITVDTTTIRYCGKLTSATDGNLFLSVDKTTRIIPLASVKKIETVPKCPY